MSRCREPGCRGRATEADDLCLFHTYRPVPPRPRLRLVRQTVEERLRADCPERVCPHCGKLCASEPGVEFHIELKHGERSPAQAETHESVDA